MRLFIIWDPIITYLYASIYEGHDEASRIPHQSYWGIFRIRRFNIKGMVSLVGRLFAWASSASVYARTCMNESTDYYWLAAGYDDFMYELNTCTNERMDGWLDGWMNEWMNGITVFYQTNNYQQQWSEEAAAGFFGYLRMLHLWQHNSCCATFAR